MSNLFFYKTAEFFQGKHGYSLELDNLEKGTHHYQVRVGNQIFYLQNKYNYYFLRSIVNCTS